ncbi:hypothetical protein CsatB_026800 [Cannabis sativa]
MTEKERLVSMGFSEDLAAQALSATGGSSPTKAVEWILNHKTIPSSDDYSFAPPIQPKLHRFFNSKPDDAPSSTPIQDDLLPLSKRLKSTLTHATTATATTNTNPTAPPHLPLYDRMRPCTLDDVVGQDHLLAPNSLLRSALHRHRLPSLLFWGPPEPASPPSPKPFLTHSPTLPPPPPPTDSSPSLLSRVVSRTFVTPSMKPEDQRRRIRELSSSSTRRAADDSRVGLTASIGMRPVKVEDDVIHFVSANCDGDACVALNALEISATTAASRAALQLGSPSAIHLVLEDAKEALQLESKHDYVNKGFLDLSKHWVLLI